MRRPAAFYLVFFACSIVFFRNGFLSGILSYTAVLYVMKKKWNTPADGSEKSRYMILLITVPVIAAAWSLHAADGRISRSSDMAGEEGYLTGTAWSYSVSEGAYGSDKVEFIISSDDGGRFLATWYTEEPPEGEFTGCRVKAFCSIELPQGRRNPGMFDYSLYLKSEGIGAVAGCSAVEFGEREGIWASVCGRFAEFRKSFLENLERSQGKEKAGLQKGIMFGIKDDMSDEMYSEFQKNGTAHLLATSGLHMGILYSAARRITGPAVGFLPNTAVLLMMFAYVILADFNASIIRAFIMIALAVSARITARRYDMITAGSTAAIAMLTYNPYYLYSAGFQMSFLAIFILSFISARMKYTSISDRLKSGLMPVVLIQLGMAPYIAYNFNYFSLSSFIANPPVTAAGTWVLILGILASVWEMAGMEIPELHGRILGFFTELMMNMNRLTYAEGKMTGTVESPSLLFMFLFYGLLFLLLNEETTIWYMRGRKNRITAAVFLVLCVSFCGWWNFRTGFENCNVIFIDVGQGNSILFTGDEGTTVLADGGGKPDYSVGSETVAPVLLKNRIGKIDYALITHLDTDHYKGITELGKAGMIKKIITYDGNRILEDRIREETGVSHDDIVYVGAGDILQVDSNIRMEILAPEKGSMMKYRDELESGDENSRSLVLKTVVEDTSILVTGDIDIRTEEKIMKAAGERLRCDVLLVPHHGSPGSSGDEFIKMCSPYAAVIQTGKNTYGHPAPEVIEKYEKAGIIVFRNDTMGAIGMEVGTDGKTEWVSVIEDKKYTDTEQEITSDGGI